tara:strand:+ start:10812 stop:12143 length:1332 start_codon:yes stop_codon:yes gene_type:complete
MSVFDINIDEFKQDFTITDGNKYNNGEVHTDFKLVNEMLDLIPNKYFKNPNLKWLDPCAGRGYFGIILYKRLFEGLKDLYPDTIERHNHITGYMLHMNELNSTFIPILKKLFGENCNIFNHQFTQFPAMRYYDVVIGNPPYNSKGQAVWSIFIEKSLSVLKGRGLLNFIVPSIWMKNDHPFHKKILKFNIKKLKTFSNTETNKIFHGEAQTPTCYFLIQNIQSSQDKPQTIEIFDKTYNKYTKFVTNNKSIPLFGISIINKLKPFVKKAGHIIVKKTNMRPGYKGLVLGPSLNGNTGYPNIKSCILNGLQPQLVINFSNIKCEYCGIPKLVLAHKMYGFPYPDLDGLFGISNRDNYVILNKTKPDFLKLYKFLSTNFIITIFEATRYRMKYLERYIFEMLPDITKLEDFPEEINDETIFNYFKLNEMERNLIKTFHKKNYLSF